MPQPTLTATVQAFEIDDVGGVTLTDIIQDTDGNYVRQLRITGIADANNPSPPLVFSLTLKSSIQANVTVSTPVLTF